MGGHAINLLQSLLHTDKQKHKITVIHGISLGEEKAIHLQARLEGIEFVRIKNLRGYGIHFIDDIMAIRQLMNKISNMSTIDILHTHTVKAFLFGLIFAGYCRTARFFHTFYGGLSDKQRGTTSRKIFKLIQKRFANPESCYIASSETEKRKNIELLDLPDEKTAIARCGIDFERIGTTTRLDARTRLNIRDNTFVICTVARFTRNNNHEALLDIARILRSIRINYLWLFLGDGERLPSFRRMAQSSELTEKLFFAGWVEDIHSVLPACDAFCLAPLKEPLGRSFVEAQAEGLPVVGSSVGAIPEIVINRKTGFLHPPDDSNAMAGSLKKLYDEHELRRQMSDSARKQISDIFSSVTMARTMEGLYERISIPKRE